MRSSKFIPAAAAAFMASTGIVGAAAAAPGSPSHYTGHVLSARSGAARSGSAVAQRAIFTNRVFSGRSFGLALANVSQAQYPVITVDGGAHWRIDGPQLHVDAADGPAAVESVGLNGSRTLYAYGPSVIDVSGDGGKTWYQTFFSGFVGAVVTAQNDPVAYVQNSPQQTWQYVTRDSGRTWSRTTSFGG